MTHRAKKEEASQVLDQVLQVLTQMKVQAMDLSATKMAQPLSVLAGESRSGAANTEALGNIQTKMPARYVIDWR